MQNQCNQFNQTNQWFRHFTNSNRIQKIDDASQFNTTNDVKHFYDITNTAATDFTYDNNANITQDNNKNITTTLNFLNLPQSVIKKGSNLSINYLYDATGNKLQTIEGATTTDYINGIQYTNGNLTSIATAEGRVRPKSYFANNPTAFVYDYYIKDHLGNVRVTITEEDNRDYYMATMEAQNDATERTLFDNVPQTRYDIPYTYPPDSTYTPNASISRLNGQDSTTIGHAKILQVRPGDNLTFDAKYFYHDSTATYNPNAVNTILSQLSAIVLNNNLLANGLTYEQNIAIVQQGLGQYSYVGNFLTNTMNQNNTGSPDAPQAYLVYLTFDEGFNLIESQSGMLQVTNPEALGELAVANLNIENNGFVYIYVNNNSSYAVNFDNLRIAHKLANVMEVNNYYPGVYPERSRRRLLNSSLSYSRSGNRYKYQTKEVDNYFDYNVLDFGARHYDAAAARWTAYDPASQFATPYIAMGGNPVSGIDPTGTVSNSYQGSANLSNNYTLASNNNNSMDTWFEGYYSSSGGGGVDINWDHHDYGTSASGNEVNFAGQIAGIIANAGANGGSTLWGPTHLWLLDNSGLNFDDWAQKHFGNNLNFLPPMSNPNWTTLSATAANLPEAKVVANRYLSGDEIFSTFNDYANRIDKSLTFSEITEYGLVEGGSRSIRIGETLGWLSKGLRPIPYIAAGTGTISDVSKYQSNKISGTQLTYNLSAYWTPIYTGIAYGGQVGGLFGALFLMTDVTIDMANEWTAQTSIWISNFNAAVNNGWIPQ